jgi:hypothetical protein
MRSGSNLWQVITAARRRRAWFRPLSNYDAIAFDRSTMVGQDGASLESVKDLFTGVEIATAAGAARPTLTADGVDLNGSSNHLSMTTLSGATPQSFSIFAVVTPDVAAAIQAIYSPSYFAVSVVANGYKDVGLFDGTSWVSGMAKVDSRKQLLTWVFDSPSLTCSIYRDGELLAVVAWDGTVTTPYTTPKVGALNSGVTHLYNGKIHFFAHVPSALSGADLALWHSVLLARFGLAFDWQTSIAPTKLRLIAGVGMYTDAGKTTPAGDTDSIYVWEDQSGNGLDVTQATAGQRPTVAATGGAGGGAGVLFTRTNQSNFALPAGLVSTSPDWTAVMVYDEQTAVFDPQWFCTADGGGLTYAFERVGGYVTSYTNTNGRKTGMAAITGQQMLAQRFSSQLGATDFIESWRDGELLASTIGALSGAPLRGGGTIGAAPALGASCGQGTITDLAVYDRALTDYEFAIVQAALLAEYGLAFDWQTSIAGPELAEFDDSVGLWQDAGKTVPAGDTDPVYTWENQVAGGVDAVQSVLANRPLNSVGNGVDFDGSSHFMSMAGLTSASTDYTLLTVYRPDTLVGTRDLIAFTASDRVLANVVGASGACIYTQDGGPLRKGMNGTTSEQLLGVRMRASDTSIDFYRDGEKLESVATYSGTLSFGATPILAAAYSAASEYMDGAIRRIRLYSRALTDYEHALVSAGLLAEYDLAFSPDSVANLDMDLRADIGITLDGSTVSQWADRFENYTFTCPDGVGYQPPYNASNADFGGHPTVSPAGAARMQCTSSASAFNHLHNGTGQTTFHAVKINGAGTLIDNSRGNPNNRGTRTGVTGGSVSHSAFNGSGTPLFSTGYAYAAGAHVMVTSDATARSPQYELWEDETSYGSGAYTGAASATAAAYALTIYQLGLSPAGGYYGDLEHAQTLIYTRELGDLEIAAVTGWLKNRYGMAA